MSNLPIRVVVADDQPTILVGLSQVLGASNQIQVVGSCRNSTELVAILRSVQCDVLISEYTIPDEKYRDGLNLIGYLKRNFSKVGIVVMTRMTNSAMLRALSAVENLSIVSKTDQTGHIITATHAAFTGGTYRSPTIRNLIGNNDSRMLNTDVALSPREAEVMRLFVRGNTVTDIAAYLRRSKQTVSSHKRSAMRKFGASNDVELISFMLNDYRLA
jgi:two-component system, NarL family, captular synthesis response regulator RcsB